MSTQLHKCVCGQQVPLIRRPFNDEDFRPSNQFPLVVGDHKEKMSLGARTCPGSGKEIDTTMQSDSISG